MMINNVSDDDEAERDEAFEDQVEWNQGDVDDPNERQELDSDLWEPPQEASASDLDKESSGRHFLHSLFLIPYV